MTTFRLSFRNWKSCVHNCNDLLYIQIHSNLYSAVPIHHHLFTYSSFHCQLTKKAGTPVKVYFNLSLYFFCSCKLLSIKLFSYKQELVWFFDSVGITKINVKFVSFNMPEMWLFSVASTRKTQGKLISIKKVELEQVFSKPTQICISSWNL